MSETEKLLKANEEYARKEFPGKLPMPPSRHVAVLACMDARLTVSKLLGLKTGEAHIIRNGGRNSHGGRYQVADHLKRAAWNKGVFGDQSH